MSENNLKLRCHQCDTKLDLTGHTAFDTLACPSCSEDITVPMKMGEFLLVKRLAQTAQKSTYIAQNPNYEFQLVIHRYDNCLGLNESMLEKIDNRIKNSPRHELVKSAVDCFAHDEEIHLIRKFYDTSIKEHIQEAGSLETESAVQVIQLAIATLQSAIGTGLQVSVLHPANIFLSDDGQAIITDGNNTESLFAIAGRPIDALGSFFNLQYAGPTFIQHGEFNLKSLIFSIFASLYECLCGKAPFTATNRTDALTERKSPISFPEETVIPGALKQLILNVLNGKDSSMESLVDASDAIIKAVENGDLIEEETVEQEPSTAKKIKKGVKAPGKKSSKAISGNKSGRVMSVNSDRIKNIKKKKRSSAALPFLIMLAVIFGVGYYYQDHFIKMYKDWEAKENALPADSGYVDDRPVIKARVVSNPNARKKDIEEDTGDEISLERQKLSQEELNKLVAKLKSVEDYNFENLREEIRTYKSQFSISKYNVETQRFNALMQLRENLIILNQRNNYIGGFNLKDGTKLTARLKELTEEKFVLERVDAPGKTKDLSWNQISPIQIAEMMTFYIAQDYQHIQDINTLTADDYSRSGAHFYSLAICMDWYGEPELASKYKDRAIKFKPSIKDIINQVIKL